MPIKNECPAVGDGRAGQGNKSAYALRFHFTSSCPACQALFRRWLSQAQVCADRDLAAAEHAKACGDLDGYRRLRRRGLRHQVLQIALESIVGG